MILAHRSSPVWMRPLLFDNNEKSSGSVGPPRLEMSALGQKRTPRRGSEMSASPLRADMLSIGTDVRYVPEADVSPHSLVAMNSMSSW